jgi:hypothetical protein
MRATIEAAQADEKLRRQMSTLLATPNALVAARDTLDLIATRVPGPYPQSQRGHARQREAAAESPLCGPGLQPYMLIMVANRLAVPWHLIPSGGESSRERRCRPHRCLALWRCCDDHARRH